MATIVKAKPEQSKSEIRQWDIDFSNDVASGTSLSSVTATHIPPSGSALTPTVGTPSANQVAITLGPLTVTGTHVLKILGTMANGNISELRIEIVCSF